MSDEQVTRDAKQGRIRRAREAAVRLDSQPLLVGAIDRLRGRLPGDERFGDPLSTAGGGPAQLVAREAAALHPDRPSAAHELGLAALQMWQALSEKSGRGRGDQEVSVLFTDLVGFSSWALQAGDAKAVELLREAGVVLETAIEDEGGRIVKRLGDGLMAVFEGPEPAVEAALAAHQGLSEVDVDGYEPQMRAGVHHGRPRKLGGDYLGVDVNVAARVAESAKGRQLLVSDAACKLLPEGRYELGRAKRLRASGAPREFRVREVKGIASPAA